MPSNYTGNPTATQAPSPQPGPGVVAVAVLPVDGDPRNAASVAQSLKMLTDGVTYLNGRDAATPGAWVSPTDFAWNAVGASAPLAGWVATSGGGILITSGAGGGQAVAWPLRLRLGMAVNSVDVRVNCGSTTTTTFKLWKWTGLNTAGGAPTMTQIGPSVTLTTTGRHTVNLPASAFAITNDTQLFVEWIVGAAGDQVEAYRVN